MRTGCAQLLAIGILLSISAGATRGDDPQTRPAAEPSTAPAAKRAAVVTLEGVIDDYSRDALFKRFAEARTLGAEVVILKLDTPGGLVTAGLDISRFLKRQDDLHVVAFVHDKAYSAGIMVGLACDELVMEPGSYVGDSAPIVMSPGGGLQKLEGAERAKAESPILADFHDSAVRNGYNTLLAEAMVSYGRVVHWVEKLDESHEPRAGSGAPEPRPSFTRVLDPEEARQVEKTEFEGANSAAARPSNVGTRTSSDSRRFVNAEQFAKLVQDGWQEVEEAGVPRPIDGPDTLLTVSANVAHKIGLAKAVVNSPEALAAERGYTIVANLSPGGGEKFVSLLGGPAARGLLLVVFLLSLYVALHTPGAGGAEAVAMISLGLLVGIPLLTGYAQWWEIAAIVIGLCLLAMEIFVIPGFGVAGISGLVLLLGGLIMTFVGNAPGLPGVWQLPQVWAGVQNGLLVVVIAFAASGVLALWLRRYLPKLPYFNRLVLATPVAATPAGALAGLGGLGGATEPPDAWPFAGTVGRAISDLHPGGSAEFPYADDRRVTAVVCDSGFVPAGTKLAVREVRGNRVVVRPVNT